MECYTTILGVLIALCACRVFGGSHHESTESDSMHFYYDPTMHHLIAATSGTCFMVPLTHVEQDHVHSTQGIEDLELTMMRNWLGQLPEVKVYHDDIHLPDNIRKWCHSKDIYVLERNVTESSTPISPLASQMP